MVKRLIGAAFFISVGAVGAWYGLDHHIVRTKEKTIVVPKAKMELADSYVDIREWTLNDFKEHPVVVQALIDNGHKDVVLDRAGENIGDVLKGAVDKVLGGGAKD